MFWLCLFVFASIHTVLSVVISVGSAIFHHVTGQRTHSFYNTFIRLNIYDVSSRYLSNHLNTFDIWIILYGTLDLP